MFAGKIYGDVYFGVYPVFDSCAIQLPFRFWNWGFRIFECSNQTWSLHNSFCDYLTVTSIFLKVYDGWIDFSSSCICFVERVFVVGIYVSPSTLFVAGQVPQLSGKRRSDRWVSAVTGVIYGYRAFRLLVKIVVSNTCYWLKQIT